MGNFIVTECFGCKAGLPGEPGVYYCAECVAKQLVKQDAEREAFDAFHAFADKCAEVSR